MIKLLIADDDTEDILLFEEGVSASALKISVTAVTNSKQLIEKLEEEQTDVLLLDVNMPQKDGVECITEIRSSEKLRTIPIVVFSTSDHKAHIQQCLNAGANHYLIKPSTFAGMMEVVDFVYNIGSCYRQQHIAGM